MSEKILLASLNGESAAALTKHWSENKIRVDEVRSIEDAEQRLRSNSYDVFIARYETRSNVWRYFLEFIKRHNLSTKSILLSKTESSQDTELVCKAGAADLIFCATLGVESSEQILQSISRLGKSRSLKGHESVPALEFGTALLGNSQSIMEVRSAITLVAKSDTAVLITGESGTGKEVVARLVHMQSGRVDQPFIALNCAALPRDIIENELFGHERGAFTGAHLKKAGCFEIANGGTLFFDEIAEMSTDTQAKLLRAIETKSFRRLGGGEEVKVNVRTIAATNKKMEEALKSGEFREDLYYRFSVIEIVMPPLRERREDIQLLAEYFLKTFRAQYKRHSQRFSEKSMEMLTSYDWPGNVRELRNVVERCVVTCQESLIHPRSLPERISSTKRVGSTLSLPIGISLDEAERKLIQHTIAAYGNNKSRAAEVLGLSRKTLHNKLRKISI